MLTVYRWRGSERRGEWVNTERVHELSREAREGTDVWWIDLQTPTAEEENVVFQQFLPIHPLTLEDVTKPQREPTALPHFPKVEEFADYLFVVVNPLDQLPSTTQASANGPVGRPHVRQLSAVLTHNLLITHHYEPLASIKHLGEFLDRHPQQTERGPDYLFHLVLDAMVDEYAPAVDLITDRLDEVENEVFGQPTQELLAHLLKLKRDIVALRKTLILEREVLARLTRGEFALIDVREMAYYRNVYDHLVRYSELVESAREMVTDLMQTHLAAVSNRLNQIMKGLTMISTVVLPMTLVAGVYGMNFDEMPETKWKYGYPFALLMMTLAGIGGYFLFKLRKWI